MKKKVLLFLVMTIVFVCYSYFFMPLDGDEVCIYGFSYNIANGAVPYKDFNMVVLPLYSLLMAIPLKFIANNLFIYHLSNAIIFSLILTIISKDKIINILCICGFMMAIPVAYSYNSFCVIIFILILYLESSKYKYKNEIICILLGIILTTKQNLGIVLFIPYILHSKDKIKSIVSYLIPILLVIIYLIVNNALLQCIDYCFLGLSNFKSNFSIFSFSLIIVEFIIINFLIYSYVKSKDVNYLYLLFFQFMVYPILDIYHIILSVIPIIYYLLENNNNKYICVLLYILAIIILVRYIMYAVIDENNSLGDTYPYKYRHISQDRINIGKKYIKFVSKNKNERIFIFSYDAYYVKMMLGQRLDKFDLINKGNMGKNEKEYVRDIEKICDKKECIFIMNINSFKNTQLNPIMRDYVLNNYRYCGDISKKEFISYYCKNKESIN